MSRFTRKSKVRGGYQGINVPVAYDAQVIAPISENGAAPLQNGNPYSKLGGYKRKGCKRKSSKRKSLRKRR